MSREKNGFVTLGVIMFTGIITACFTLTISSYCYSKSQFHVLNQICGEMLEKDPETEKAVFAALKKCAVSNRINKTENNVLEQLGYLPSDFSGFSDRRIIIFAAAGILAGTVLLIVMFRYQKKKETMRVQSLCDYLEQVNMGKAAAFYTFGEDAFSKLGDEIYKTVTSLYQTRDEAVQTKNDFAENLSNIAHQIKTPITAISLTVQTLGEKYSKKELEPIERQLGRLTHLEESLLILTRLDAGTLFFQKEEIDVFTILVLAADNLQEFFERSGTSVDIPELGEMAVTADLEWTMEAVINIMKNCMEHQNGGTIHCSYEQNPLYTQILIWDEGEGFYKEDLPHIFERFYRGQNAAKEGIGIGLALSKEIIERQNGTIRAKNLPGGGACFEIRFYDRLERF